MGFVLSIKIKRQDAQIIFNSALSLAKGSSTLPVEWTSHARAVFDLDAKTWTPALCTLLLAKATDERVDALSIKLEESNPRSYNFRSLGHDVVVPAAVEHRFSIRTTGREPLNNQPFFRYDRIDKIDRVRRMSDLSYFLEVARSADRLSAREAKLALAAFLRTALEISAKVRSVRVKTRGLTAMGLRVAVSDFLRYDAADRPPRLQAFAAACLDLMFDDVRTRRINDPSRDLPGDVHAMADAEVLLAMEVRGKRVSQSDLISFALRCAELNIHRAVMFVDAPQQPSLALKNLSKEPGLQDVQVEVFEWSAALLNPVLLWSSRPHEKTINGFAEAMLDRLREIEVPPATLEEWTRAVAIARGE
ncbi:restriction endonuclease, SacI family [Kocuria rhizophila]|uniref:restriction endonuclease, SacI family n=1 Tax=Kocuria rhizophila TaxID=72000 RepID=UPI0034DAD1CF